MALKLYFKSVGLLIPKYGRPPLDDWWRLKRYIFVRDLGICQFCWQEVQFEDSQCHHLKRVAQGGSNHPDNLWTVCFPCHCKLHPWLEKRKQDAKNNL